MRYTNQQEEIFAAGVGGSLTIIAYAGSGKTTTLVEMQRRTRQRALYCPFNASIAEEAQGKFAGTGCRVSTLHAFAWDAVRRPGQSPHRGGPSDLRSRGVLGHISVPRVHGWGDFRVSAAASRALARFCNSDATEIGEEHARQALIESVGDPAFLRGREARERAEEALSLLSRPVAQAAELYMRDLLAAEAFTHDLYLKTFELSPALIRSAFAGFKLVYKDEAQDSNPVETSILRKSCRPIISVGDRYQQIYSWRGAVNALGALPGPRMHLTESFRFGPGLAAQAMRVLAARPEDRPELPLIGAGTGVGRGRPANAILCRTNAGVLEEAVKVAKRGHSYFVDNARTVVADLRGAEALHEGGRGTGPFSPFGSWAEAVTEAQAGDAALDRLIRIVEEGRTGEVVSIIEKAAPEEEAADITLMTAHRSKGREFPFVRLGEDWRDGDEMRARWAKAKTRSPREAVLALEEYNALYVAVTRAERRVYGLEALMPPDAAHAHVRPGRSVC